jgi:hypothetical protein
MKHLAQRAHCTAPDGHFGWLSEASLWTLDTCTCGLGGLLQKSPGGPLWILGRCTLTT